MKEVLIGDSGCTESDVLHVQHEDVVRRCEE